MTSYPSLCYYCSEAIVGPNPNCPKSQLHFDSSPMNIEDLKKKVLMTLDAKNLQEENRKSCTGKDLTP